MPSIKDKADNEINYKKLFNPFKLDKRLDECFGKIITSFYRFLTPITQKPAILKIETAIKKMGVKEVRLGNNIEDAQNIYKAVKIAFNNHDILPTHIFVPIFPENIHSSSKAFFEAYTKNNKIIVYAPEKRTKLLQNINQERLNKLEKSKDFSNLSPTMQDIARVLLFNKKFSTNVPCGVMLHEIGHANQKIYLPQMSLLDLTEKDALTIQKLTNYCYHDDVLSEAFAELYAKLRAHGVEALTKDELNLWKRMNSGYFTSYEKKLIRKLIKDKNSY